ncbi:MAG TPA: Hsp20/alpha crystallin family protein [Bacteroidetes bacterium]|nr:Hsp20/alpha crystallin family protein [Bacteroidota bacterium]
MSLIKFFPAPVAATKPVNAFDNFFGDFFRDEYPVSFYNGLQKSPAVNVVETDDGYRIEVAAPGLDKKDFEVKVDKDLLTISAHKEVENETTNEKYTKREFSYTEFARNFHLPETVDPNAISADYKNGILNVTLAKKEEAKPVPPKTIKIK